MLQQLLEIIRQGGSQAPDQLAKQLNTSPQMVSALLGHLQRTGYLRRYTTCETSCQGCSLLADCARPGAPELRLWELAE